MRFFGKLFIILFLSQAILPIFASAYQPESTHAGLTEQVIGLYNKSFENKIDNQKLDWIIKGSIDEDSPSIRSLNHFYDPVRNIGIEGYRTAKIWATGGNIEANEYSWPKIIQYYAEGNEEKAFIGLGHILHLTEDMLVPDHTRNDQHMDGSPYENWTGDNKNRQNLSGFYQDLDGPISFSNISEYFDFLAKYSNENFFSKDTIEDPVYLYPKVIDFDGTYGYGIDEISNQKIKLFGVLRNKDGTLNKKVVDSVDDHSVVSEYFSRLAPQAVRAGAGVVDLFLKEAEKARVAYQEKPKDLSFFSQIGNLAYNSFQKFVYIPRLALQEIVGNGISVAEYQAPKVANFAKDSAQTIGNAVFSGIKSITTFVQNNFNNSATTQPSALSLALPKNEPKENNFFDTPNQPLQKTLENQIAYAGTNGPRKYLDEEKLVPINNFDTQPATTSISLPDIDNFLIDECVGSFVSSGCLVATTTLSLSWSIKEDYPKIDYFLLDLNGVTATTTSTNMILLVDDNKDYIFSISAIDSNGPKSATSTQKVSVYTSPVVINEIAWGGTKASSYDEWIELYNKTPFDLDLNGWTLYASSSKPTIALSGKIKAKDYFLLERKDDDNVSDVSADILYGNDGSLYALNNVGEKLFISDNFGKILDETILSPVGKWPAGSATTSMERIDPNVSGSMVTNWRNNLGFIKNGKDKDSNLISGTPRAKNSVAYLLNKGYDISEDIILTKSNSPYVISFKGALVSPGANLFIEPGVVIKFYENSRDDSANLFIFGNVISLGTLEDPVIFTTLHDNENGGVLDPSFSGDISHERTSAIYNFEGSASNFDNVKIRNMDDGLFFFSTNADLKNIHITDSNKGINIYGGNVSIADSFFDNIKYRAVSIFDESNVSIANFVVENTLLGDAVSVFSSTLSCEFCNIANIPFGAGLNAYSGSTVIFKNSIIENTTDYYSMGIFGSSLNMSNSKILNSSLSALGVLSDSGSLEQNINLTDSELIGGLENGIAVFDKANIFIDRVKISDFFGTGILAFAEGDMSVKNSVISNNNYGIEIANDPIFSIESSDIFGNAEGGLFNYGSNSVLAINNWWGDESGPYQELFNSSGLGDGVTENVDFSPWLGGVFALNFDNKIYLPDAIFLASKTIDTDDVEESGEIFSEITTDGEIVLEQNLSENVSLSLSLPDDLNTESVSDINEPNEIIEDEEIEMINVTENKEFVSENISSGILNNNIELESDVELQNENVTTETFEEAVVETPLDVIEDVSLENI